MTPGFAVARPGRFESKHLRLSEDRYPFGDAKIGRYHEGCLFVELNRPGFTGGQNPQSIARYETDTKEKDREAVFT